MPNPSKSRPLYIGYNEEDRNTSPYAAFYSADMDPLPAHVQNALLVGVRPHGLLPGADQAARMQAPGYEPIETGYSLSPDGAARVFVLTRMPGVMPAMWNWWFAWHGSDPLRYKLWHPQSHLHVAWEDGRADLDHYIGRTSYVSEYLGARRHNFAIRFVRPAEFGFDEAQLAARGEVVVCARAGIAGLPADGGAMVHHIRPTADGSEMRSRFWLSGENVRLHGLPAAAGAWTGSAVGYFVRPSAQDAVDLLIHCAQEMNHLAERLPAIHAAFSRDGFQPARAGKAP